MVSKKIRDNMIYVFLAVFFIGACGVSENFRTMSNIMNLFSQSSIIGVLAIGQTIVLIQAVLTCPMVRSWLWYPYWWPF